MNTVNKHANVEANNPVNSPVIDRASNPKGNPERSAINNPARQAECKGSAFHYVPEVNDTSVNDQSSSKLKNSGSLLQQARNEEWAERQWVRAEVLDGHPRHPGSRKLHEIHKSGRAQHTYDHHGADKSRKDRYSFDDRSRDHSSENKHFDCDHASQPTGKNVITSNQYNVDFTNDDPDTSKAINEFETNARRLFGSFLRMIASFVIRASRNLMK